MTHDPTHTTGRFPAAVVARSCGPGTGVAMDNHGDTPQLSERRRTDTPPDAAPPGDGSHAEPAAAPDAAPPNDLAGRPVWNLDDVARALGRPRRAVRELVGTPGFPRPRRHNRQLWWLQSDILDWVGAPAQPSSRRRSRRG